jgi:hypothetical protein
MKAFLTGNGMPPRGRAAAATVIMTAALNGTFLIANGLFMLFAPLTWYEFVPGVTDTGFFNQHFIRDIGMIQTLLGVAFVLGLCAPERRVGLWAASTSWLCAHALFHFWEVAVGICSPAVSPRDFPAVTLPALLGLALTLWALRNSPPESPSLSIAVVSEPPGCAAACIRRRSR